MPDNPTDQSSASRNTEYPEQPTAQNAAEDPENDIDQDAVAAAFHYLASEPSSNQPDYDPIDQSVHFSLLKGMDNARAILF